jgi:hypothetical protein
MRKRGIEITPGSAQLRLQAAAPVVTISPTLEQLLAREKPKRGDIARFLAAVKVFHELGQVPPEFRGADSVPIPPEVVTMIGEYLAGKEAWATEQNAVRAQAAAPEDSALQARAEEIWRRQPHLSNSAVAKLISPKQFQRKFAQGGTWQNRWPTHVDAYEAEWVRFKAA